ncbi:MAG: hypothetical protein IJS72_00465 [Oscillospiraceae bacterium]|nr:hypothetical protein [Oscillospiraceae bacterium]
MTTVGEVFEISMSILDNLNDNGAAIYSDNDEYLHRTPTILRTLISEFKLLTGERGAVPELEDEEDLLIGIDDVYALGALPYGLAAQLVLGEDSAIASFLQQRYEELRLTYAAKNPSEGAEDIEDVYGGTWPHNNFGAW